MGEEAGVGGGDYSLIGHIPGMKEGESEGIFTGRKKRTVFGSNS